MKKIYSTGSLVQIAHLKNVLEAEGIACVLKGENLFSAFGEIPAQGIWPQLFVVNAIEAQRAVELIRESLEENDSDAAPWVCDSCGESVDDQFAVCWQCGALPKDSGI